VLTETSLIQPSLLESMGYDSIKSQLLTVPPYAIAAIICICCSFLADRLHARGIILLLMTPLTITGFAILATVPSTSVRYFALYLTTIGAFTCSPILLAWVVSNSAGPTVRAIVSGYGVGMANIGAIIATWTYIPQDAPRYIEGHWINFGAGILLAVSIGIAMVYLKQENRKRSQGWRDYRTRGLSPEEIQTLGHLHPEYRYTV
jgi:sugar phosphate permease